MTWLFRIFHRRQLEEQLDEEVRFHLDQHAADLMARGDRPDEAIRKARLVPGVRSAEPSTFAVMITVLVIAALFASFLPARRASHVDPMSALRQE